MTFFEPHVDERAAAAEAKAERIFSGQYETLEDAVLYLKYVISSHYKIPFYDPYFNDRTLDELVFEARLISLEKTPAEAQKSQIVNKNKEELQDEFKDWDKELDDFEPVNLDEMSKQFMNSNEFITE